MPRQFVQTESLGDATTIRLTKHAEHFDTENAPAVTDELLEVVREAKAGEMLLDLQNVRYLTSTGLTVLLALRRELGAAGARLSLCNPSPQVAEVLEATRLITLFEVRQG